MLAISKQVFQRKTQQVIDRLSSVLCMSSCRPSRQKYAVEIIDKVMTILAEHSETGCTEADFVPHFKLEEADLVQFTLNTLHARTLVKREVRYFIRPIKECCAE